MQIQPTLNRVLIAIEDEYANSKIIVSPEYKERTNRGTVVAVGGGRRHIDGNLYPPCVKVGDKVMFNRGEVFRFENDGQKMAIGPDESIYAVVRE